MCYMVGAGFVLRVRQIKSWENRYFKLQNQPETATISLTSDPENVPKLLTADKEILYFLIISLSYAYFLLHIHTLPRN